MTLYISISVISKPMGSYHIDEDQNSMTWRSRDKHYFAIYNDKQPSQWLWQKHSDDYKQIKSKFEM